MRGYPKRTIFFDTETVSHVTKVSPKTTELTLRLGCAIFRDVGQAGEIRESTLHFNESRQFHDAISDMPLSRDPIYVFAHNAGFDTLIVEFLRYVSLGYYGIVPEVPFPGSTRYKDPLFIADDVPFIVRLIRRDGQVILILDSRNYLAGPLKEIAEKIGMTKGRMPGKDATDDEWRDYCEQDCRILKRAMERLFGYLLTLRFPDFRTTMAGQAMMIYKMRFERKRIDRPKDMSVFWLDRHAYYGGYVEAFYVGLREETTYQIDVTSLYPFVMRGNPFPCAVEGVCNDPTPVVPDGRFDPRRTTAEVWLDSREWPYPIRGRDETLYCTGQVRTILCGPELEHAIQMDHVRYIGRYVRYVMDDLFSEYVDWLWSKRNLARKTGDEFGSSICKGLLNSLQGKFGQKVGDWVHKGRVCSRNDFMSGQATGEGIHCDTQTRVVAGHYFERARDQEDERGFAPISAWVASYARMFMHDARNLCGIKGALYQATDALLVTGEGLAGLQLAGMIDGFRLGTFRHDDTFEWVAIHGQNAIDTPKGSKRPGVPPKLAPIAPETYAVPKWETFEHAIGAGKTSSLAITEQISHFRHGYGRRRVQPDGWTVPHAISNWDIPPEEQRKLSLRPVLIPGV